MNTNLVTSLLAAGVIAMPAKLHSAEVETKTADSQSITTLRVEARLDYQRDWRDGNTVSSNSGFEGKAINLRLEGNITDNLSYCWRHRFNRNTKDANFFDATDRVYLAWNIGNWTISGGKQAVAIGGWEYDHSSIDLYGCSVFWNNVSCYQIGVSAAYNLSGNNKLMFQFCESPFYNTDNRNLYAYNLYWTGAHGIFQPIWSANLLEYSSGRYISYLVLGNKLSVDRWSLELDFMNRASSHQTYLFKDCSVMGELSFRPTGRWRIHGKMTYDVNRTDSGADLLVLPGTELKMIGGGGEFYPFAKNLGTLRFHANAYYSWGKNANANNVMQNKSCIVDFGVKWDMNLLSLKRK